MSRCYPYPPPGYLKNGIRDEALIESIKIQREEQKAKKERKKEKRDKEEKKREKREGEKGCEGGEIQSKKHGHKKRHKDKRSQEDKKGKDHHKRRRDNEVEDFEKSTLTVEHCHAVGSQNSSDSTLNSDKRQKLSSPYDSGHNCGSIIRIRLPSQRHKDPEVLPSKEQPCSTSGRNDDAYAQGMHEPAPRPGRKLEEHPCSTFRNKRPELTFKLSKEKPCSSSSASENLAREAEASLPSNLCRRCSPTLALHFKNLVEDWIVPTLQSESTNFDDDDGWLLLRKQSVSSGVKSSKDETVALSQLNSTSLPHACYLSEADIYALPFTIPF